MALLWGMPQATESLEVDLNLNQVTPSPQPVWGPLPLMCSDQLLSQPLMLAKVPTSPVSLNEACTFWVVCPLGHFLAKLSPLFQGYLLLS